VEQEQHGHDAGKETWFHAFHPQVEKTVSISLFFSYTEGDGLWKSPMAGSQKLKLYIKDE